MSGEKILPTNRSKAVLYLSNLLLYGFTGLYYCFIQLYLKNNTTHSEELRGILLAVAQGVAIFAPLFWGVMTDKARYKKTVLLIIALGVTIFYCAVPISNNFWWLLAMLCATMFFLSALGSVLDVIGMEVATSSGINYGPMRLMGMFGYGFVSFVLSIFVENNLIIVFNVCAVLGLLCSACILLLPKIKGHANAKNMLEDSSIKQNNQQKPRFFSLFKEKKLLVLIAILATAQFAYGYYLNFFPTYLTVELKAPTWLWGTNVLLTTLSEAPFYLGFDALFRKFGVKKIIPVVLILTVVRYLLLALFTNHISILVIGLLTGALSVSLLYTVQFFVNKTINPQLKASAQTLVYAVGLGVPRMLSSAIGGFLTSAIGTNYALMICSAVVIIGLGIYFIFFSGKENKQQTINN